MINRLPLGVTVAMVAGMVHAAEIKLVGENADGISVVSISGGLILRDIERFADVTKDLTDAIISFSSDGGNLSAGIEIGTRIRLRGYRTVVANQQECYSACALAWLGGTVRYIGRRAQVGFHAAYRENDGRFQETGVGNAVVGSYAANLGLRTPAIIFMTSAPPEWMNHLTQSLAQSVGIAAEFTDTDLLVFTATEALADDLIGSPNRLQPPLVTSPAVEALGEPRRVRTVPVRPDGSPNGLQPPLVTSPAVEAFGEPRRVRTVPVRPDGSIVEN